MSQKVVITGVQTSLLPKLTAKETDELLHRIKKGETHLKERFIEGNMRLVLSIVQRFHTEKESADDLFQVGVLGLIKALDNFDVSLNVRFSTYAVPMIMGEIRRFIREGTALKVGRGLRDIAYKAMQARDKLELSRSNEANLTEIASEIGVPYSEVVSALDAISCPVSIFESVYSDGEDSVMVLDQISDSRGLEDILNEITLSDEIKKLPERERQVLTMRYYQGRTQTEISQSLQMSQAQVSRLEKSALAHMREAF
jgi:RNA polymerase sporulation-specific sigma factor